MTASAITGLPRLSPDEAHLRQLIPAALNGLRLPDGAVVRATMGAEAHALWLSRWFRCADGMAFAIERLDGRPVHADARDGVAAALLIEQAEPLLAAVEQALGIALEPHDLSALEAHPPRLVVAVTAEADGVERDRVLIALPHDAPVLPVTAPHDPALTAHVPVPVVLHLAGPRLSPAAAASLLPGDLLLLGAGPLEAQLHAAGATVRGRLDPVARCFVPDPLP